MQAHGGIPVERRATLRDRPVGRDECRARRGETGSGVFLAPRPDRLVESGIESLDGPLLPPRIGRQAKCEVGAIALAAEDAGNETPRRIVRIELLVIALRGTRGDIVRHRPEVADPRATLRIAPRGLAGLPQRFGLGQVAREVLDGRIVGRRDHHFEAGQFRTQARNGATPLVLEIDRHDVGKRLARAREAGQRTGATRDQFGEHVAQQRRLACSGRSVHGEYPARFETFEEAVDGELLHQAHRVRGLTGPVGGRQPPWRECREYRLPAGRRVQIDAALLGQRREIGPQCRAERTLLQRADGVRDVPGKKTVEDLDLDLFRIGAIVVIVFVAVRRAAGATVALRTHPGVRTTLLRILLHAARPDHDGGNAVAPGGGPEPGPILEERLQRQQLFRGQGDGHHDGIGPSRHPRPGDRPCTAKFQQRFLEIFDPVLECGEMQCIQPAGMLDLSQCPWCGGDGHIVQTGLAGRPHPEFRHAGEALQRTALLLLDGFVRRHRSAQHLPCHVGKQGLVEHAEIHVETGELAPGRQPRLP